MAATASPAPSPAPKPNAELAEVVATLRRTLPPTSALRRASDAHLLTLAKWAVVALTNPRPQWPPPPAPPRGSAQARAIASTRPTLESVIEALGGRAGGPPAGYESEGVGEG